MRRSKIFRYSAKTYIDSEVHSHTFVWRTRGMKTKGGCPPGVAGACAMAGVITPPEKHAIGRENPARLLRVLGRGSACLICT